MNAITKIETMSPSEIYTGDNIERILAEIKEEVLAIVPDVSTKKGQAEIKSLASKVSRSKTFLDGVGKNLADQLNAKLKPINGQRKDLREFLDNLKAEVREPVTRIEDAEKKRIADLQERLLVFDPDIYLLSMSLEDGIKKASEIVIDSTWQEFELKADKLKIECVESLTSRLKERQANEAKQAELEAERQKQMRERIRIEEEAKARKKIELEQQAKNIEAKNAEGVKRQQEWDELDLKLKKDKEAKDKQLEIELGESALIYANKCEEEVLQDLMIILFISKEEAKAFLDQVIAGKLRHLRVEY